MRVGSGTRIQGGCVSTFVFQVLGFEFRGSSFQFRISGFRRGCGRRRSDPNLSARLFRR